MKSTDFLLEDYYKALKEHQCIYDCTAEAIHELKDGNIEAAESLMKDAQKSITTLQKMKKDKELKDAMESLVTNLRSMGIDVVVMQKKFGGSSL